MMRRFTSGAEARGPGQRHDFLGVAGAVVADPQPVAHAVEPGQVGGALAGRDQVVGRQRVREVRAGHLDDLGAQGLQELDGLGEPGQHPGLVAVAAQFRDHPDAQAAHVGLPGGGHHRRDRRVHRGRVARVVPGDRLVQQRRVQHGPGQRPGGVQRRREGDQPVPGRAAVGRLDPDDPAHRGGLADRPAGVGADAERRLEARDRRGRAARRPAGHPGQVPRVAGRPERRVLGGRAHRELVHVRLAQQHHAGLAEPPGHGRVVRRLPAVQDAGARRWSACPWW